MGWWLWVEFYEILHMKHFILVTANMGEFINLNRNVFFMGALGTDKNFDHVNAKRISPNIATFKKIKRRFVAAKSKRVNHVLTGPLSQEHLMQVVISHTQRTIQMPFYKNQQLHSICPTPLLKQQLTPYALQHPRVWVGCKGYSKSAVIEIIRQN